MEPLQFLEGVAAYCRQFTTVQDAIVLAVCAFLASVLTNSPSISLLYILGLCVSFHVAKYLLAQARYLHSEWILRIVRGVKITKLFIKSVTEEVDVKKKSEPTWKELIHFSVPHGEAQSMIHCITRDFISSWYGRISTNELGPAELEESLEFACNEIFLRIQTVDKYKLIEWVIQFYKEHVVQYQTAAKKLKQQPRYKRRKSAASAGEFTRLKNIEEAFEMIGAFHPAAKSQEAERVYLLMAMRAVLFVLLPEPARNCEAVAEGLTQILARSILLSLMDLMCDPHWIHKTIIRLVSTEEVQFVDPLLKDRADAKMQKAESDPKDAPTENEEEESEPAVSDKDLDQDHDESSDSLPVRLQDIAINKERSQSLDVPGLPLPLKPALSLPAHLDEEAVTDHVPSLTTAEDDSSSHRMTDVDHSEPATCFVRPMFIISDPEEVTEGVSTSSNQHVHDLVTCPTQVGRRFSADGESLSSVCVQASIMQNGQGQDLINPDQARELGAADFLRIPGSGNSQGVDSAEDASSVASFETEEHRLFRTGESEDGDDEDEDDVQSDAPQTDSQEQDGVPSPAAEAADAMTTALHSTTDAKDLRSKHLQSPTHIFLAISISTTEMARDRGGAKYTLYLIEFTANHKDDAGNWSTRRSFVKRRYREFVTLQDRLEEHPLYKKSMKGVWGPQRWNTLPLGNLSVSKVEHRRRVLTKYLQTLISMEDVGNSMALREFLAYEGDATLAFVKKAPEMPRIDKMLQKTFSGVVDKISSALPSLPYPTDIMGHPQGQTRIHRRQMADLAAGKWVDTDALKVVFAFLDCEEMEDTASLESVLSRHRRLVTADGVGAHADGTSGTSPVDVSASPGHHRDGDAFYDVSDVPPISIPRSQGDGCDGKDVSKDSTRRADCEIPLGAAVIDLALQLGEGRESWVKHHKVIQLFKVLFGRALDTLLHQEIEDVTTEKRCTYILYLLRETLWPGGVRNTEPYIAPSDHQRDVTKQQAVRCLKQFLPGFLPLLVGADLYDHALDQMFTSLENPKLNRHLLLCLLDHLLQTFIPELRLPPLQRELLRGDKRHYGAATP